MLIYMNDLPSLLADKDKLFIVANICIKNINRERGIPMLNEFRNYFSQQFDNTIKFFVMPVLLEEKQGIEVLNPVFADNNLLKKLNESYEKILKLLEEKSLKND